MTLPSEDGLLPLQWAARKVPCRLVYRVSWWRCQCEEEHRTVLRLWVQVFPPPQVRGYLSECTVLCVSVWYNWLIFISVTMRTKIHLRQLIKGKLQPWLLHSRLLCRKVEAKRGKVILLMLSKGSSPSQQGGHGRVEKAAHKRNGGLSQDKVGHPRTCALWPTSSIYTWLLPFSTSVPAWDVHH